MLCLFIFSLACTGPDLAPPIVIDGHFEDWSFLSRTNSAFTIARTDLKVCRSTESLLLSLHFPDTLPLQDPTVPIQLTILDKANTAVFRWNFGRKKGRSWPGGTTLNAVQSGLLAAPTVWSDRFELQLPWRTSMESGKVRLSYGQRIAERRIPARPNVAVPEQLPGGIPTKEHTHLRLTTYNVFRDGHLDAGRGPSIRRIIKAIRPDILLVQEVPGSNTRELEKLLPDPGLTEPRPPVVRFSANNSGYEHALVSRFPVVTVRKFPGYESGRENGLVVLDTRQAYGCLTGVVAFNPPCCGADRERQVELNRIATGLKEFQKKWTEAPFPIFIAGDSDFVGDPNQLQTVLELEIWPGSDRILPRTALTPHLQNPTWTFTYYSEQSPYLPGKLDYIFYPAGMVQQIRGFTLFTLEMSAPALEKAGLRPGDTSASDHLPVTADFILHDP